MRSRYTGNRYPLLKATAKHSPEIIGVLFIVYWGIIYLAEYLFLRRLQPPVPSVDRQVIILMFSSPWVILIFIACAIVSAIRRNRAWILYLLEAVCIFAMIFSFLPTFDKLRNEAWSAAFHRLTISSQPLVTAIERYSKEHAGKPPTSLSSLVPRYIASIPPTGIEAFPQYRYNVYRGVWTLRVPCPRAILDFSRYEYTTPESIKAFGPPGEVKEKCGNWVYIRD